MPSYNRVILVGHLTRDPELSSTDGGKAVCEVGLAVNERYRKEETWVEKVVFVDVTFWGKIAEVVKEYCHRGSPLLVEGKLQLDTWEKDGQKRSKLRVVAQQMRMLRSSKKEGEQSSGLASGKGQEAVASGSESQF